MTHNDSKGDGQAWLTRSCRTSWKHSTGRWRFGSTWGSVRTPGCCHLESQKACLQALLTLLLLQLQVLLWSLPTPHPCSSASSPFPLGLFCSPTLSTQAVAATGQFWESTRIPASDWLREEHMTQVGPMRVSPGTFALTSVFCQALLARLQRYKQSLLSQGLANYSSRTKTSPCHLSLCGRRFKNVFHIS